ncbi:ATP-binding protein [Caballeronia sp. NCTM1]|uniref:hybrid sensor histidine kinase/response regulator n=1 Tax=Caballeronia sp. NCTM1 TaxID=2921753 RepID=UPI002028EE62|nr:ATP-binding protein [Caballeronia sp. NCTM1]
MSVLADPARLNRLKDLRILDTPVEPHFDALSRMTAHVLRMPRAFINFVDGARSWCKSAWGSEREERPHAESLCAFALENMRATDDIIVLDASRHPHIRNHPEVTGESRVVFYMAFVLRSADGLALGTLCVKDSVRRRPKKRDFVSLRILGEQVTLTLTKLLEKHELAQRSEQSREQFLAMLAHELRAPMSPILTAVDLLNRHEVVPDQREWAIELIGRHARHLSQIVESLLSTSMVSLGVIELNLEAVNVNDLIDAAIEMTEHLIAQHHHSLTRSVIDQPVVLADRVQCPLILVHLIRNAAKYTPEHGKIEISAEGDDDHVKIIVKDNGIGIAKKDFEEIFQVFGQSHRPLDRASGGIGLGLPFARRLAEWHRGSLHVRSDGPGKGSEFILTLQPTRKGEQEQADACLINIEGVGLDIVIVDDNVDTADALALYCQIAGHRTRVAYHSDEALRLVSEHRPDVLISDIGLPEIDGYELVRKLRSMPGAQSSVYVAITGYGSSTDKQLAREAGFDKHFSKPVDLAKLDDLLKRVANMRRPRA